MTYETMQTAQEWREYIAAGRNKQERPTANNTTVRMVENGVAIRLHSTDIVTVYDNGDMRLDSGQWRTNTTKERINRYSNAGISQKNNVWYMRDGSLFYDGIVIDWHGTPKKPKQPEKYEAKLKQIKKQAKEYARGYVEAIKAGQVPFPSAGDCWMCLMFKERADADHIRQHIKDKYYVPSLLVNAGHDAGYQDFQVGMMGIGGQRLFIEPERIIYKYVVKQLQKEM